MLRSTSREGGVPSGGAGAAGGGAGGAGPVSGGEWSERFFYLSGHFLRYKKHSLNLTSVNLKQVFIFACGNKYKSRLRDVS